MKYTLLPIVINAVGPVRPCKENLTPHWGDNMTNRFIELVV
jgi:hypothetical protein